MIANPMTAKEPFESFYRRKLDELWGELKIVIKSGLPYVTSEIYACHTCKCRILLLTMEGKILCMRCIMPVSLMPSNWSLEAKRDVFRLMSMYPSLEDAHVEWQALQSVSTPREKRSAARVRAGDTELGKRIRAAREKAKLSQDDLAHRLRKKNGARLSRSAIQNYECGEAIPSAHIMGQLQEILGLE